MKKLFLLVVVCLLTPLFLHSSPREPTVYREDFESIVLPSRNWRKDIPSEKDLYEDNGSYFRGPQFTPPTGVRADGPFGKKGWLAIESYSRDPHSDPNTFATISSDPENKENKVLKILSPQHSDGTIIRNRLSLTLPYKICLKVGHAKFGDGVKGGLNGYMGEERAAPWGDRSAVAENGFYWLTILDDTPRPRNNIWIHHHRKLVIDSDNNTESWTNIWDGRSYRKSGEHPVMMFALPREAPIHPRIGKPFISLSNEQWHPVGMIRAADAYKDGRWYTACIARSKEHFTLSTSGDFVYGGNRTYSGTIRADQVHNHDLLPEYFMFGDPHTNFYRGEVLFDDIELTLLPE